MRDSHRARMPESPSLTRAAGAPRLERAAQQWRPSAAEKGKPSQATSPSSKYCALSQSVVSDPLWRHGLWPTRFLCPWGFSRQEYGNVGCHFLRQGIFPTQGSNPGLPYWRWVPVWATREAQGKYYPREKSRYVNKGCVKRCSLQSCL